MTRNPRTPADCRQKRKNRPDTAFTIIDGQQHQLGRYGSAESRQRYYRLLAEYLSNGRHAPAKPDAAATVAELCAGYWRYAQTIYVKPDGTPTTSLDNLRQAQAHRVGQVRADPPTPFNQPRGPMEGLPDSTHPTC